MKKILFATSEAVPFIKAEGLADIVGFLPKCLDKEYFDVRIITPEYLCIRQEWRDKMKYIHHFYTDYLGQSRYVDTLQHIHEDIIFYSINNESYSNGAKPYGDWCWDLEKLCFFCRAALSALFVIKFQPDMVHCHDWQTGLIPALLRDKFRERGLFCNMKSVITIHNLKFWGVWDVKTIERFTELPDYYFTLDKLEAYKDGNLLKGGIAFANATIIVSNAYAEGVKLPSYGEGLDGLMRSRAGSLRGIVDGIDYDEFNPKTDTYIVQNYSAKSFRKGRIKNRKALQQGLDLPMDKKKFMMGIVSRLTDQEDFDLTQYVMDRLCSDDLQLVVPGTGEERYENMFRHCNWKYHDRVSAQIYYSEVMSRKIYVASDAFLIPSPFEPCGLSRLMALRYDTAPIVRETGGPKDTVEPHNEYESKGAGFSFVNYNAYEILGSACYAEYAYNSKRQEQNKIIDRTMARDYSWWTSITECQELYD